MTEGALGVTAMCARARIAGAAIGDIGHAMSEETVVLTQVVAKRPAPRLPLPALFGGAALAASVAAVFLFVQSSQRGDALAAANAENARLGAAAASAEGRVRKLEHALAEQKDQLDRLQGATLPVDVSFAVAAGGGFVARFQNHATQPLGLVIEPRRASTGEYGRIELTVNAEGSAETTEKQGWTFKSGDTLTVSAGEYRALSLQVP